MSQGKMMGADFTKKKLRRLEHRTARDLIVVIPSGVEGPLTFASVSETSGTKAPSHGIRGPSTPLRFAQDDNQVELCWPHGMQSVFLF